MRAYAVSVSQAKRKSQARDVTRSSTVAYVYASHQRACEH